MAKEETTIKRSTPGAQKLSVEELAKKKGLLPRIIPAGAKRASTDSIPNIGTRATISRFPADQHNPEYWKYAAAKAYYSWPEGMELTEEEFDAAIVAATTGRIG